MPGEPDPRYIIARRTLLDVLEALEVQRRAVIVVGAQAIYLHTGEADVALAPYTTDGDLVLDVDALVDNPTLSDIMERTGFHRGQQPGCWISGDGIVIHDVYRLLRGIDTQVLSSGVKMLLAHHLSAGVTAEALEYLDRLFRRPRGVGCQMVVRAAGGSGNLLVDAETVAASCAILATDLLASTRS